MSLRPLVSVVINTYNYADFIERSIESALEQTYPQNKIEIIVVDDGSTDDTSKKIKKYGDKIKYIYKNNGGQASAFNTAFKNINGKYIVLLDADDCCMPKRVETIVMEFEKYPDVACILNSRRIKTEQGDIEESFPEFHNLELNKSNINYFIKSKYGTSRTSVRKRVLDKILPLPEQGIVIEADLYLNLSIIWHGNLSCINEQLTEYFIHGNNLFSISSFDKLPLQISSMKNALISLKDRVRNFAKYDEELLEKIIEPYEIELLEKDITYNTKNGKVSRLDVLKLEIRKIVFGWRDWGNMYRFYKLSSLPLYFLLSPEFIYKLKNYYSKNKLFKIREKLFN